MATKSQKQQLYEIICEQNDYFEEGKIGVDMPLFDQLLSNIYRRYNSVFHPSRFLSIKEYSRIKKGNINIEELKSNIVEQKIQERLCTWFNQRGPLGNSTLGIDKRFGELTKIIGRYGEIDWDKTEYYKFFLTNIDQIRRFKDKINWQALMYHVKIPWSIEFISEFEPYLFVNKYSEEIQAQFSYVNNVQWSFELIEKYDSVWNWKQLSANTGIKWSKKLISKYKDKWSWDLLSKNPSIKWTKSLLYSFKSQIYWKKLSESTSVIWTIDLIKEFEMFWNWEELTKNSSLPWDIKLIQTFSTKWYWFYLCGNQSIKWNAKLIRKFKNKVEWYTLSGNPSLKITKKDIDNYKEYWRWDELCQNATIPIDSDFLDKYENYINFQGKVSYGAKGRYHYNVPEYLMNKNLRLAVEAVKNLSIRNKWKIGYVSIPYSENDDDPGEWVWFSRNKYLSRIYIEKFKDLLDWKTLSSNEYLPWTLKLVLDFKERWYWDRLLDNDAFWNKIIEHQPELLNIKNIDEMFHLGHIKVHH